MSEELALLRILNLIDYTYASYLLSCRINVVNCSYRYRLVFKID